MPTDIKFYTSGLYKDYYNTKLPPIWYEHKNDLKSYDIKVKLYKDGSMFIKEYKQPIIRNAHAKINRNTKNTLQRQHEVNNIAKTTIYDYARNNDWNYFITLTYNSEKVDRYSFIETSKKVRKFMNNYSRIDDGYSYLIVYEQHKDGAYHYHGLINVNNHDTIVDSGVKKKGKIIYNWRSWSYGFSTLSKIVHKESVCKYIIKYITKTPRYAKGFRKYYHSNNLSKPIEITGNKDKMKALEFDDKVYETEFSIGYNYNMYRLLNNI